MPSPRKKTTPIKEEKSVMESAALPKSSNPLVFISHDTRDAELAEEFSNLLKSASAGGLKSFRSSDKKGTQGIEYGLDWYPAIMDKIDEASDVVCLLTQRSVDRPWILYEAGVAKGKLGKKVIGIAMGIQHSIAFTGPFAQFQNNDGSVESITKLVIDLVCNVPGLDPDKEHVAQLVQAFHEKALAIVSKYDKPKASVPKETDDNIMVAKLFEEVKIMFESLPARIENRIEPNDRRKRRRMHPMMLEDMMILGTRFGDSGVAFLMMVSAFKDDYPWFYEIGLETYRGIKNSKSLAERKKIIANFERMFELLGHPIVAQISGKEDPYLTSGEIRHFLQRYISQFANDDKRD